MKIEGPILNNNIKRIGLFFGSFNPPHIGHMSIIANALNYSDKDFSGLDAIMVIPAWQNPWKIYNRTYDNPPTYNDRLTMTQMICENSFGKDAPVYVWDIERQIFQDQLNPQCYTSDVLDTIEEYFKDKSIELYIVTTMDTFADIIHWHNGNDILQNWKFCILEGREDDSYQKMWFTFKYLKKYYNIIPDYVEIPVVTQLNISSTMVRNQYIGRWTNYHYRAYFVGGINVDEFITKNNFYKDKEIYR
jgi:nicotinate (nicotinamide) nucleotide adenylyltransferase